MLGASDETSLEQRALLLEQALGVDPAKESE
jgi:hypothetical protein